MVARTEDERQTQELRRLYRTDPEAHLIAVLVHLGQILTTDAARQGFAVLLRQQRVRSRKE